MFFISKSSEEKLLFLFFTSSFIIEYISFALKESIISPHPSDTISGNADELYTITGVPQDNASIVVNPNDSYLLALK